MSLEKIVRPAQSPDISPAPTPRRRRTTNNAQAQIITLKWGVGGNITQVSGSISEQFTVYQVQKPTEKQAP